MDNCKSCNNCIPDLEALLSNVPANWRKQIATAICRSVPVGVCCQDVLNCIANNATNVQQVNYNTIINNITNQTLVPGVTYQLTDFQTTYNQSVSNVAMVGPHESLFLLAVTPGAFAPIAYSSLFPQDVIYYNPLNDGRIPGSLMGYIYRRIDTEKNIDLPLDWRNILYRRYALNVTSIWANGTTYSKTSVVIDPSDHTAIYFSKRDSNTGHALTTSAYWYKFDWANGSFTSPTKDTWELGKNGTGVPINPSSNAGYSIPVTNTSFQDYKIFSTGVTTNTFNVSVKASEDINLLDSNNSVFYGSNISENIIGNKFINNTIGNFFQNNTIGDSFAYNSIASNFTFNNLDKLFYKNVIGTFFKNNKSGSSVDAQIVGTLAEANFFASYLRENVFGDSFINNTFGLAVRFNVIGNNALANYIGSYSESNIIGDNLQFNRLGTGFLGNTLGDGTSDNTIGEYCQNNTFGGTMTNNVIGSYSDGNTFTINFQNNTIGQGFSTNTGVDTFQNNSVGKYVNGNTFGTNFFGNRIDNGTASTSYSGFTAYQYHLNSDLYLDKALTGITGNPVVLAMNPGTNKVGIVTLPAYYGCTVTQTSTSAPVASGVAGTYPSGTPVWSRISTGVYRLTLTGAFSAASTLIFYNNTDATTRIYVTPGVSTPDYIEINTLTAGVHTDGLLNGNSFKVQQI